MRNRCIIIGGGIVGLSTGYSLQNKFPDIEVIILEKEAEIAVHQTGRNSGVIHSGIYYKPGSLKARLAKAGSRSIVEFCEQHNIDHKICGKIIVATAPNELENLHKIYLRGLENGLKVEKKAGAALREIEPNVAALEGIYVPTAGIVDYVEICKTLARRIIDNGGQVQTTQPVVRIEESGKLVQVYTQSACFEGDICIACAGLHSDRLARRSKMEPGLRIIPFKGEYFELVPQKRALVNGLIYPVPNPDYPFLGVHLHRMIDDSVHAGPNAVLSFKREGYGKLDFNLLDAYETLSYPGFWKFAKANYQEGVKEFTRSMSKNLFLKSLQRLVPAINKSDLIPGSAGVRAQALDSNGGLIDDFRVVKAGRMVHVCNAPSPAATASLEIGKYIVDEAADLFENHLQVGNL